MSIVCSGSVDWLVVTSCQLYSRRCKVKITQRPNERLCIATLYDLN
jgi:hypothetical protein